MTLQYQNIEALLQAGLVGNRQAFNDEIDHLRQLAKEQGDDGTIALLDRVGATREKGEVEDKTDLSDQIAAFDRKLENVDDIPVGLSLVKTNVSMDHVILPEHVKSVLKDFLDEQTHNRKFLEAGLQPRNKAMFIGPPGNGKTQVTKAIANYMDCPLYFVRYDSLITQRPGETSKRLNRIFQFAKTHRCILFFDEIDAIGKERGDDNEAGEMKRVVSTLLVQLDDVPPHIMCLGATNHPGMIDRAMWRRFQIRVNLPNPGPDEFEKYLKMAFTRYGFDPKLNIRILGISLEAENFAEVEVFVEDCVRAYIRNDREVPIEEAIEQAVDAWPRTRVKIPT